MLCPHSHFTLSKQRDLKEGICAARATEVNQTRAQDEFSRIWLYFAVQKSFGAFRRHKKHRLCHINTAVPFGPSQKPPGVQKILPHLACSVICSLNFIKIKTQRSLRHSCVPTDVNSLRSLKWRLSSVPRTKPTFAATIDVVFVHNTTLPQS